MIRDADAVKAVERFARQWGEPHSCFAQHAAFPLAITPDLLYRLWATFRSDIFGKPLDVPWIAVADLLLSPLCSEVGYELFEMRPAIQRELLARLRDNPALGERRFAELSAFVASYYADQLKSDRTNTREFAEDQQWAARTIAVAYIDPARLSGELAREDPGDPRRLRLRGFADRLPMDATPEAPGLPIILEGFEALQPQTNRLLRETLSAYHWHLVRIGYKPPQTLLTVIIDPQLHDNAYYDPSRDHIVIAKEFAADPDVILREYTHHVLTQAKRPAASVPWTAIQSGLADYFPCSFHGNPRFGEKLAPVYNRLVGQEVLVHGYVRNMENQRKFSELKPDAAQQDAGEVWSGAFWEMRARFGKELVDPLLFQVWTEAQIHQDSPESFAKFADNIVSAAHSQPGIAEPEIRALFESRGLLRVPDRPPRQWYTPLELAAHYNFPDADGAGQVIALVNFGGTYKRSNLQSYLKSLGLPLPRVTHVSLNGSRGRNSDRSSLNSITFEIEVIGALTPRAHICVYSARDVADDYPRVVRKAVEDKVSILQLTWGGAEPNWRREQVEELNQILQEAAMAGITVVASAGDRGATEGIRDGRRHVVFPASSPWVLAVGGTKILRSAGANISEVTWNDGAESATGGGISELFAQPDWQSAAGVPAGANARRGRGLPDVAAHADPTSGCAFHYDGMGGVAGGTVLSASLWTALIARLNQLLGRNLGHIAPVLYGGIAATGALRNITQGHNGVGGVEGWSAGPGWNPVTGWGSPDGRKLLDALRRY